jgi:hypothetical protein
MFIGWYNVPLAIAGSLAMVGGSVISKTNDKRINEEFNDVLKQISIPDPEENQRYH